jgi:hypothetical protein
MGAPEALLVLVILSMPVALAAYVASRLAKTSKPPWRRVAWIPVLPLALVDGNIFLGVTADPTSHNLWPFEVVLASFLTVLLFGVVLLLRRLFGR